MEGKVHGFLVTFVTVMACLIFYNWVVRPFTPTSIQSWIST